MNKRTKQKFAFFFFRLFSIIIVGILIAILGFIAVNGLKVINWEFLSGMPKEGMTEGGIFPAIVGTCYLIIGSLIFAVPLKLGVRIAVCAVSASKMQGIALKTQRAMEYIEKQ